MPQALAPPVTAPVPAPLRALPRIRTGYPLLDVESPVVPGRLVFFDHPPERTYYGLVASATTAGRVLVVDGANRFDAYSLVDEATRQRLDVDAVLSATWIARAFTVHQMQSLVEDTAARYARECSLVLVSGVGDAYMDPDTPRREGPALLKRALRALTKLARDAHVPVVVTNHSLSLLRDPWLTIAARGAEESVLFRPRGKGTCVVVLPQREKRLVCRADGAEQALLQDWDGGPA